MHWLPLVQGHIAGLGNSFVTAIQFQLQTSEKEVSPERG